MNDSLMRTILDAGDASSQTLPANSQLFCLGDTCDHYVVVKSGTVRVELLTTTGNQLLLYRINSGESCVMTTSCLLGNSIYDAQAITESDVELVLIRRSVFQRLIKESPEFLHFVFENFSARLASMVQRTTELTTQTVDQRLASVLLANINDTNSEEPINLTHRQLAIDIGSAREVVSRRLAHFEKNAVIERQRGQIVIRDHERLRLMLLNA